VATRAQEEGGGFVLILVDASLEVFSCRGVVSAHLGKLGHGGTVDGLEPFGRS